MSRPRSADPKSVKIGVAVTEATAAALDARRGDAARSPYVEALILADLASTNGGPPVKAPAVRKTAPKRPAVKPDPDAALAVPFSAVDPANCPHPKGRVHKGLCGACGRPAAAK